MEKPYRLFSYRSSQPLERGMLVEAPFGKRSRIGCVWGQGSGWDGEVKEILAVVQPSFWGPQDWAFLAFCQDYYHAPLQEVLQAALPSFLRRALPKKTVGPTDWESLVSSVPVESVELPPQLTAEQQQVIAALPWGVFYRYYLYGVTGSGKTRCYLEWLQKALKQGNVLLMIPEIHLSHQILGVIERYIAAPVVVYHSQLTPKKRREVFSIAAGAPSGVLFLSTRSGIFLPIRELSLIIVDEEHDHSYKQHEGAFRYHARDLAMKKAQLALCPCVLGSATPSMKFLPRLEGDLPEAWGQGMLTQRATGYPVPKVELVMVPAPTHDEPLGFNILKEIRDCLQAQQHVLIYLNQRGYVPKLFCPECRKMASCPSCLTSLTAHQTPEGVAYWVCHHCLRQTPSQMQCQDCQVSLVMLGFGTQRLASYLQESFPEVPVVVLDTDHLKNPVQVQQCFEQMQQHPAAILVGTQMISKGHDWSKLSLVVILVAAYQLKEQVTPNIAQQIMQTAGRSGRHQHGRVLLPLPHQEAWDKGLEPLLEQDYLGFMRYWKKNHAPQRGARAKFLFQSRSLEELMGALRSLCTLNALWGPCLDYPYRRGALWRAYALLIAPDHKVRAQKVREIGRIIEKHALLSKSFSSVEIDPLDF